MLERDKILLSTQAHFFSFYSAAASGTCLSTNGISNESLQYIMITLPHSVMCHDFFESEQAVTVHLILTL